MGAENIVTNWGAVIPGFQTKFMGIPMQNHLALLLIVFIFGSVLAAIYSEKSDKKKSDESKKDLVRDHAKRK